MKLDEWGIKQYQMDKDTAQILRESLLDSEETILKLGKSVFNYPEDQITGKQFYYNLLKDNEEWWTYGLPFVKKIVADYLSLVPGEEIKIKSWGNILRDKNKIYPHVHFGTPDNYNENPQSVSGNIFLGSEEPTSTTYILGGQKTDVPNSFGQFTLFPPSLPHAVRSYKGEGLRISAAFDCFCTSRDPNAAVSGKLWYSWTHNDENFS